MSMLPLPLVMKAPINTHTALAQSPKTHSPAQKLYTAAKHSCRSVVRTARALYVNLYVCMQAQNKQRVMCSCTLQGIPLPHRACAYTQTYTFINILPTDKGQMELLNGDLKIVSPPGFWVTWTLFFSDKNAIVFLSITF